MKQYKFSLKDECMKELPSIKEPKSYTGHPDNDHEIILYINRLAEYEKHLASLQSLPVPKEYLSSFVDGKIYNEDDFEIKNDSIQSEDQQGNYFKEYPIQFAIPKQVEDTELRDKISDILYDSNGHCGGSAQVFHYLQKHYTITRK